MSTIEVTVEGPVATLTFAQPPMNCLTPAIMDEWIDVLCQIKEQPYKERPRAIMIQSGIPGVFSLGMDPQYLINADLSERRQVFLTLANLMECFYKLGIPVVADVAGSALAGGAVLALLADFVIVDRNKGKICFSEAKVGLPVPAMVQKMVRSKCLPQYLAEVCLLGKNLSADRAAMIGLANEVYETSDERRIILEDLLGRITRIAPQVLEVSLQEMKSGLLRDKEIFIDTMDDQFSKFLGDNFLIRGLKAVVSGEKISW